MVCTAAANDSIKSLLKDERLQQQILRIDKTADREKVWLFSIWLPPYALGAAVTLASVNMSDFVPKHWLIRYTRRDRRCTQMGAVQHVTKRAVYWQSSCRYDSACHILPNFSLKRADMLGLSYQKPCATTLCLLRMQALQQAFQNADFKAFTDQVLQRLGTICATRLQAAGSHAPDSADRASHTHVCVHISNSMQFLIWCHVSLCSSRGNVTSKLACIAGAGGHYHSLSPV